MTLAQVAVIPLPHSILGQCRARVLAITTTELEDSLYPPPSGLGQPCRSGLAPGECTASSATD
jgi:hypothetical protein